MLFAWRAIPRSLIRLEFAALTGLRRPCPGFEIRILSFPATLNVEAMTMAKGQLRGNRETKKPKKIKPVVEASTTLKGSVMAIALPKKKG